MSQVRCRATRSAASTRRGLEAAPRSARRAIAAARVSAPARVTRITSGCSRLTDAGGELVAAALGHRARFAGEERFVGARCALHHHPVGRDALARGDASRVGRGKAYSALRPQQRIKSARGAAARSAFEVARAEQQEREHADRIEVHLARARERWPRRSRAKPIARPSAIGVSRPMRPRRSSCSAPEKNGWQENSSTGNVISRLAQRMICAGVGPDLVDVGGKGIHHHLHRAEPGDEQPPQGSAALAPLELVLSARLVQAGVVAHAANRAMIERSEVRLRVPGHVRASGRIVHVAALTPGCRRSTCSISHRQAAQRTCSKISAASERSAGNADAPAASRALRRRPSAFRNTPRTRRRRWCTPRPRSPAQQNSRSAPRTAARWRPGSGTSSPQWKQTMGLSC